jgi:hypothetical protein
VTEETPSWHRGRSLTVALALATSLGVAGRAEATCPPFDLERTALGFLGLLQMGRLTAADREAIMKGGVIPGVPVGVWPPNGPAPLRVGVIWLVPPEDPRSVEFDADGDGTPDIVDTQIENLGHTYARPGEYRATLRVRTRDDQVTTYVSPVSVLPASAFEAQLQERWATFKTALHRGNLSAALECVHSSLRNRLEADVRDLLRTDIEPKLPPIRFVEARVIEAVFVAVQPAPGGSGPIAVHFAMDSDGIWRLASFGDIGGRR